MTTAQEGMQLAVEPLEECLEILGNLIDSIKRHGNYTTESTCAFIDQAAGCVREALAALSAAPPAGTGGQGEEPVALHMQHPIWVLNYLHVDELGAWPSVHTYAFTNERDALKHQRDRINPNEYHVHKTWLQTAPPSAGLIEALKDKVVEAARSMPRSTPAPGGCSTVHQYAIAAGVAWALDKALIDLDAALSAAGVKP